MSLWKHYGGKNINDNSNNNDENNKNKIKAKNICNNDENKFRDVWSIKSKYSYIN